MTEKLPATRDDLATYEATIQAGQASFIAVGEALAAIREAKLYKLDGFSTFDAYCAERWGFKAAYARRQIDAAETVKSAPTGALSGKTEFAIRPLVKHRKNPKALAAAIEKQDAEPATRLAPLPDTRPAWWTTDPQKALAEAARAVTSQLGTTIVEKLLRAELRKLDNSFTTSVPTPMTPSAVCPHPAKSIRKLTNKNGALMSKSCGACGKRL